MKFWLVLLILGWRLRWLCWRNEAFRAQLKDRNVIMQWRTEQGSPARWFHFMPDKVIARGGIHENPTVSLSFEGAAYAFETLKVAGKNQMVFMEGMNQGKIKIDGDAGQLMWFMTLMKYIAPKKKKAA